MQERRRSHEGAPSASRPSSATPDARPEPGPTASPFAAAAVSSAVPGKPSSAATGHAHGASSTAAHHVLLFLVIIYWMAHVGILLQHAQLWLHGLLSGRTPALLQTMLVMLEVVTVGFCALIIRAMVSAKTEVAELADRAFVQFGVVIPLFQCLYTAVSPNSWEGERRWWGFHASMTLLSVLFRYRPSHSLLHAFSAGFMLT